MKMYRIGIPNRNKLLLRLTGLLLTAVTLDAVYLYCIVAEMAENIALAAERYHAVPMMAEHILAAVVLYLLGMILIGRGTEEGTGA